MNQTTKMALAMAALALGTVAIGWKPLPHMAQAFAAEPIGTVMPDGIIYGADESPSFIIPTATPVIIPTATPVIIPTATPVIIPTATPVIVPTATPTPVAPLPVPKSSERGTLFFSSVTDAGVDASPLTGRTGGGAIFEAKGFNNVHLFTRQGATGGMVRILNISLHVEGQLRVGQRFPIVRDAYTPGARVLYTQARGSYNRVHSSQSGTVIVAAIKGNRIQAQLNNVRLELNDWATVSAGRGSDFILNGTLDVKNIPRLPFG